MTGIKDFLLGFGGLLVLIDVVVWSLVSYALVAAGVPFWGTAFTIANLSVAVVNLAIALFYTVRS